MGESGSYLTIQRAQQVNANCVCYTLYYWVTYGWSYDITREQTKWVDFNANIPPRQADSTIIENNNRWRLKLTRQNRLTKKDKTRLKSMVESRKK